MLSPSRCTWKRPKRTIGTQTLLEHVDHCDRLRIRNPVVSDCFELREEIEDVHPLNRDLGVDASHSLRVALRVVQHDLIVFI